MKYRKGCAIKMEIFYEKSVPKTGTTLTEKQFGYLMWLVNGRRGTKIYHFIPEITDETIPTFIEKMRESENDIVNGVNGGEWLETNNLEKYDFSDSDLSEIIKTYGFLSHELNLSGETQVERTHSGHITLKPEQIEKGAKSGIDLSDLDDDDLEKFDLEDLSEEIDWDDEWVDDERWKLDGIWTTLSLRQFPTPEIFAEPTSEEETEESKPSLTLVSDNA